MPLLNSQDGLIALLPTWEGKVALVSLMPFLKRQRDSGLSWVLVAQRGFYACLASTKEQYRLSSIRALAEEQDTIVS